jgi:uncharacterized protein (TIGR02598 family)
MKSSADSRAGFSLIEVSMTVGVIAFALVGLLGVLPLALQQSRTCVDETRAAQLARMIFATVESEPIAAARCFGKTDDGTLDLTSFDENSSPVLLFASYDIKAAAGIANSDPSATAQPQPAIVRTPTPPTEAEYRIELRFKPALLKSSNGTPAPGATPSLRGTLMGLTIRAEHSQSSVVFDGAQFVSRLQRRASAK